MLINKFFTSKRKHALYALVITNSAIYISFFGLLFYSNKASLFASLFALLLPGIYFLLGYKEYRQQHDRVIQLDNLSFLIGAGFSVLLLYQVLTINWNAFQAGVVDILVLGGLCSFTKDFVVELMTIHSLAQRNLQPEFPN